MTAQWIGAVSKLSHSLSYFVTRRTSFTLWNQSLLVRLCWTFQLYYTFNFSLFHQHCHEFKIVSFWFRFKSTALLFSVFPLKYSSWMLYLALQIMEPSITNFKFIYTIDLLSKYFCFFTKKWDQRRILNWLLLQKPHKYGLY